MLKTNKMISVEQMKETHVWGHEIKFKKGTKKIVRKRHYSLLRHCSTCDRKKIMAAHYFSTVNV